jgi:hypothetical protein
LKLILTVVTKKNTLSKNEERSWKRVNMKKSFLVTHTRSKKSGYKAAGGLCRFVTGAVTDCLLVCIQSRKTKKQKSKPRRR